MGRITIDDLDKSLQDIIDSGVDNSNIGDISDLLTDEKSTIVGAINELFQKCQ